MSPRSPFWKILPCLCFLSCLRLLAVDDLLMADFEVKDY